MDQKGNGDQKRFHYGWVVFGACFLMIFFALGFGSSTKSIYLEAITKDAGIAIDRGPYSLVDTIRCACSAIGSVFFGFLVHRFGARKLIGAGFFSLIASFTIQSFATEYWHFYLSAVFLGIGFTFTSTTAVAQIVEKWFTNSKGTAMGFILSANALGGLAAEQIVSRIVYGFSDQVAADHAHWRLAMRITVLIFAVAGALIVLLVSNDPKEKGIRPLGENAVSKKNRRFQWEGYELKKIFRSPSFYIFAVCTLLVGFCLNTMFGISRTHLKDVGIDEDLVKIILSVFWVLLLFAKIGVGYLYDRFGLKVSYGICSVASLLASLCMIFVSPERIPLAWGYAFIAAAAIPMETIIVPLVVSDLFGSRSYSRVLGYYMAFNYIGFGTGGPVANFIFDHTQSYSLFYTITAFMMAFVTVASLITITLAHRKRERFLAQRKAAPAENA